MASQRPSPKTPVPKETKVRTLQKDLRAEAHRWYELGFQLRVPSHELKKIQKANHNTPHACFMQVIDYWLDDGQDKTWKAIFEALEVDNAGLMRELRDNHHFDPYRIVEEDIDSVELVELLVEVTPDWYMFGQNLDIPLFKLDGFKDDKGVDQCFSNMLNKWLNKGPCWEDLIEALKQIGNKRLAIEIEKKYLETVKTNVVVARPALWYDDIDDDSLNEDDHFFEVIKAASIVKWENLGLALQLHSQKLQEIAINNRGQVEECRKAMYRMWFRDATASWKNLCLALDSELVGEGNLARIIAREHKKNMPPSMDVEGLKQQNFSKAQEEVDDVTSENTSQSLYPYSDPSTAGSTSLPSNSDMLRCDSKGDAHMDVEEPPDRTSEHQATGNNQGNAVIVPGVNNAGSHHVIERTSLYPVSAHQPATEPI